MIFYFFLHRKRYLLSQGIYVYNNNIKKEYNLNMIINNYKRDEMNHSVVCDSLKIQNNKNIVINKDEYKS